MKHTARCGALLALALVTPALAHAEEPFKYLVGPQWHRARQEPRFGLRLAAGFPQQTSGSDFLGKVPVGASLSYTLGRIAPGMTYGLYGEGLTRVKSSQSDGFLTTTKNNSANGFGAEVRLRFPASRRACEPYLGFGGGIYSVSQTQSEQFLDADTVSHTTTSHSVLGGRIALGVNLPRWLFIEATYTKTPSVRFASRTVDPSSVTVGVGIRL